MPENLEKTKQEDYLKTLFKDLDIAAFLKKERLTPNPKQHFAADLEIPDIQEMTPKNKAIDVKPPEPKAPEVQEDLVEKPIAPPPPVAAPGGISPELPINPPTNDTKKEEALELLEDASDALNSAENIVRIEKMKDIILEEVNTKIRKLQNDIDSIWERKTPERGTLDSDGAYRHHLFTLASKMLDEILPDLFEDIPEYSLIATQVSRLYEDGSVADGMIALTATVGREGYRYDFKVDIPILNGLLHYPLYIERGQKIIPLTKPEIQKEIESMSFVKMDVERPFEKANIFNNIGENIYRRPDEQKFYQTYLSQPGYADLPPKSQWTTQRSIKVK